MRIKIRDWNTHFERDRSKQWKNLQWVPIPNKQGTGYRKIMQEKNGAEIFGCWIAIVEQGSLCFPRGDLSKYEIEDLALLTLIDANVMISSIRFLSQKLDWLEVIENNDFTENLDTSVKNIDAHGMPTSVGSSILSNSIQSSKEKKDPVKKILFVPPSLEEFREYCKLNGFESIASRAFRGYSEADWHDSEGKKIKNWKQKCQHVWFNDNNRDKPHEPKSPTYRELG